MATVSTDRRRGITASAAIKVACIAGSTSNLTLSGEQTVDGISLVTGDRVLVKNQTDARENGIYEVDTSNWKREPDWDGSFDAREGTIVPISRGTANSDTMFRVSNETDIVVGTTSVTFEPAGVNDSQTVSFLQAGTGAVSTTVQARLRETVSVKDFNAKGDGVTDDTAAIQAAIDSGAGSIFLPLDNYITSSTLNLNTTGQSLIGNSRNKTTLLANFRGGAVIEITAARCGVHNLAVSTLSGSGRRNASPLGKTPPDTSVDGVSTDHGIKIIGTSLTHVQIKDCEIQYQPANGVYKAGSGSSFIIESCSVTACGGHGIIIDDGTHNGESISRAGLGEIKYCIIQNCWGHGITFAPDGGNTVFRYVIDNCDVFNVALGDNGTNQPDLLQNFGAAIAMRGKNIRILDSAGDASASLNSTTMALLFSSSGIIHIENFRVVGAMNYGIFARTGCDRITGHNIFFNDTLTNEGIRVEATSTGCQFTGLKSSEFASIVKIINAEVEVNVVVDGRRAKTIAGSSDLFFLDGITQHTIISTGIAEITGSVMDIKGQGDVADTIVSFRFDSGVDLPDAFTFTFVNLNAYNMSIQDNDVTGGNIFMDTGTIVLAPDDAVNFVVAGGKYFGINKGL